MAVTATPMRKVINDPADVVRESLAGLAAAHGDLLRYDAEQQIVVRAGSPVSGKVALVSGGGSGHEPLHGGFVGPGMLDAACPTRCWRPPRPSTAAPASCTSSRTTRAT
jgi:dihydroxyacetone kinase-like protein